MDSGEFSGERDGKEVRDFSDPPVVGVGTGVTEVLDGYFGGFMRPAPDFRLRFDAVDAWDEVRCRLSPPLPSIMELSGFSSCFGFAPSNAQPYSIFSGPP